MHNPRLYIDLVIEYNPFDESFSIWTKDSDLPYTARSPYTINHTAFEQAVDRLQNGLDFVTVENADGRKLSIVDDGDPDSFHYIMDGAVTDPRNCSGRIYKLQYLANVTRIREEYLGVAHTVCFEWVSNSNSEIIVHNSADPPFTQDVRVDALSLKQAVTALPDEPAMEYVSLDDDPTKCRETSNDFNDGYDYVLRGDGDRDPCIVLDGPAPRDSVYSTTETFQTTLGGLKTYTLGSWPIEEYYPD